LRHQAKFHATGFSQWLMTVFGAPNLFGEISDTKKLRVTGCAFKENP
jgi:hypothetical protein